MTIQPALPEEAAALTRLAIASKAHWGYDAAFIATCTPELTLRPEQIAEHPTVTIRCGGELAGFAILIPVSERVVELDALFVAPAQIGRGLGRRLFEHAREAARRLGYDVMRIHADPHAASFYDRMGGALVGTHPSGSIPGRLLPVYEVALGSRAQP